MEEICLRFGTTIQTDISNLIFLYSGININLHNTLSQIMNCIDKQRKVVSILVNTINIITKTKTISNLIKSDIPICSECSETIKFNVNNFQIYLTECEKGYSKFLPINEYEKTQYIDLNKIICKNCGTNKNKVYNNKMYMCYTCNSALCPLCKNNHDKKYAIVNYDFKNFMCERHYETYNSYCSYYKVNLCLRCQKYHQEQNIISFGNIFPEKDELLIKLTDTKEIIDVFKKDIKEIIYKLNKVKENIEILYNIYYEMITKFDIRKRNYEAFMSINSINTNMAFQAVQQINQTQDTNNKIQMILSMYEQMKKQNNSMMMAQNQNMGMMEMNMNRQPIIQQNNSIMIIQQEINTMKNQHNDNKNKKYIGCKIIQSNMNTHFSNSMNNQMMNMNPFNNPPNQQNNYF